MIKIIENEKIGEELTNKLYSCTKSIKIISPFLSEKMTDILCEIRKEKQIPISIITRLYLQDMLKGSNNIYAIEKMYQSGIQVIGVRGLHTKLYIADEINYFIGSANFTLNGLFKNLELVLQIDKEELKIKEKLDQYHNQLEENCIKKDGLVDNELINEIKNAFEKAKEKRGNEASSVNMKTYGASITRDGFFKDFDDPEKEMDFSKRKEIIDSDESDLIGDGFKDIDPYVWNKESNIAYYLKLEGDDYKKIFEKMKPIAVDLDGRNVYILNFPECGKPSRINNEDVFYFCSGGDKDSDGKIQRIIARGHLCEYSKDYYVKEEWKKEHSWMEKYNVYSIVRDIEVIDAARKDGINVNEIIQKIGGEKVIAGSILKGFNPKDFSHSWEGSFKKSTKEASDAIDKEFEKLVAKYGHKVFYSEL